MNLLVAVALTDDAPAALLQIARPPRAVEVVERDEPVLHVHTRAHLEGAAHEHTHLTGAHLCKQLLLPRFGVGFMDECDLLAGDSSGNELFPDVVIYREAGFVGCILPNDSFQRVKLRAVQIPARRLCRLRPGRAGFRGGQIAEHELGQPVRLPVLPDAVDVVHAAIDLAVRVVRQVGVDDALVKPLLASVRGDLEHIVGACVHDTRMNFCGALGQLLHHLLLYLRGLRHLVVIDGRGRRQVELVGGLDIRRLLEQGHELRQIKELGKARPRPVARTLGGQLDGGLRLSEGGSPAVEVGKSLAANGVVLEIAHHGVKLGHGI